MSPQFFPIDFLIKLTRVLIKSIIEAVEHSNKDQKQEDLWTPETQLSMRKIYFRYTGTYIDRRKYASQALNLQLILIFQNN